VEIIVGAGVLKHWEDNWGGGVVYKKPNSR